MSWIAAPFLASLKPSARWVVRSIWIVVILVVAGLNFWPVFVSPEGAPQASIELDEADRIALREPTRAEAAMIRRLPMLLRPLPPEFPPAQGQPPRPTGALFGLRDDQREPFARVLDNLEQAAPDCSRRLAGERATPAAIGEARAALEEVVARSGQERGFLNYHQGLIDLCGGDPGEARAKFEAALEDYAEFRENTPDASAESLRLLAQYEMTTGYGLGLSILAASGSRSEADDAFAAALEAGRQSVAPDQAGPFVTLRACAEGRGCALFDFSSADIYNARLSAWMATGQARDGFERVRGDLAQAPGYVSQHPALAANLAAAAAAAAYFATAEHLYRTADSSRRADPEIPEPRAEPESDEAWARLAALAVVASEPIYANGQPWPHGAPTGARRSFDNRGFPLDDSWFPAIALDAGDAAIIDRWLWIRRQRHQLATGQFDAFRSDGVAVRNLGPDTREFIEGWRSEITGSLAQALLVRAERIRRADGLAEARPLLALVASPGFPLQQQVLARLGYYVDAPAWLTFWVRVGWVLLVCLLAWAHLQLAAGYRRTFGSRHFEDRVRQRADAVGALESPDPVASE